MPDNEELVEIAIVADKLKVHPRTICRWVEEKGLPAYKPGLKYLFFWSEVETWLRGQKYESSNSNSG